MLLLQNGTPIYNLAVKTNDLRHEALGNARLNIIQLRSARHQLCFIGTKADLAKSMRFATTTLTSMVVLSVITWVEKRLCVCLLLLSLTTHVFADNTYPLANPVEQGWHWSLEMGALATFGVTDTTATSANTDITYQQDQFETEAGLKFYRSTSESIVTQSQTVTNAEQPSGEEVSQRIRNVTNDRRYLFVKPSWFFSSKHYVFSMLDVEKNTPAKIDLSSRQIAGLGYRLHYHESNTINAAVGIGKKYFAKTSEVSDWNSIGYLAVRFNRRITDQMELDLAFNSDFGANNRFSEIESALKWKLPGPTTVKLKYEARFNSNIANPIDTFSQGYEGALSAFVEIELF